MPQTVETLAPTLAACAEAENLWDRVARIGENWLDIGHGKGALLPRPKFDAGRLTGRSSRRSI